MLNKRDYHLILRYLGGARSVYSNEFDRGDIDGLEEKIWTEIRTMHEAVGDIKEEVKILFETKGKIPAIKEFRQRTGYSLLESKQQVEKWETENNWIKYQPPKPEFEQSLGYRSCP